MPDAGPSTRPANPIFEAFDTNEDGLISQAELPLSERAGFDRVDSDGDGALSRNEHDRFLAKSRRRKTQSAVRQALPPDTSKFLDITYTKLGTRELKLDLYVPDYPRPAPTIVWIHGGGWQNGAKEYVGLPLHLVRYGFAVAAIEYRLSTEAVFPAALYDCKAAVSFLRDRAVDYSLDPVRIGAFGESSGGHLALLLGTTNGDIRFDAHEICRRSSSTIHAVCDWFGPSDLTLLAQDPKSARLVRLFLGGDGEELRRATRMASPIHHVTHGDAPVLIMHGDRDAKVPIAHSETIYEALCAAGVLAELYRVPKAGHGFSKAADSPEDLIGRVAAFFRSNLQGRI